MFAILKGYEVLKLEEMPILEQMKAFAEATHIVATHGAGLVNLLWCLPETRVIEIVHKHTAKKVYPNLSHLLGLNHKVVMGEPVPIPKTTQEKKFKRLNYLINNKNFLNELIKNVSAILKFVKDINLDEKPGHPRPPHKAPPAYTWGS